MSERATERVVVLASPEVIQEMTGVWSSPVEVMIGERQPDGTYDMTFRTHTCPTESDLPR